MTKKKLPKEFALTDYQQGVVATLNDMVRYMEDLHVTPLRKAISIQLTQFAQEHFKYPEGTQLSFDIDPADPKGRVTVTEVEDGNEDR